MKVALVCDSPLLKKSLELYLKKSVSTYAECDFVISDKAVKSKKPVFYIGKDKKATLQIPFSKEQVLSKTQQFYNRHLEEMQGKSAEELELEAVLSKFNKKHKEKIDRIIKAYHET